jgi:hypothetical protein
MNRNKTELPEKKMEEEVVEEAAMMIKMETIEEEEEAEVVTLEVGEVAEAAAMEVEVIEIVEIEVIEVIEVEKTTVEEEAVVNGMEVTLEVEVVVTAEAAGAEAVETLAALVGTKAQATTMLIRNPIIEIPTTMIPLMEGALLTVINFQLHQHLLILKIIELKGITTLTPKIKINNLLDHLRTTQLFI